MLPRMVTELRRSNAVDQLQIIRGSINPSLSTFVRRTARKLQAPMAMLSIVQANQFWFKANFGINIQSAIKSETFCQHVLASTEIMEVCDAEKNDIFRDLPVVKGPVGVRYYIGAPLVLTNGLVIGSLCVFDVAARSEATREQRIFLKAMADQSALTMEFASNGPVGNA